MPPKTKNLFPDCRLKLERAKNHISELERIIAEHKIKNPPVADFSEKMGPDGILRPTLSVVAKVPPLITSAVIGDAIHNLRSALDLMAVRLVELNEENSEGVAFPFASDAASFPKAIKDRNFNRASEIDRVALTALQPYGGGNDKLFALHKLDILDKHIRIIPRSALLQSPQFGPKLDSTGKPVGFDEGKLELEIKPGSCAVVEYTFPNDGPLGGSPLIATFNDFTLLIEDILNTFESMER